MLNLNIIALGSLKDATQVNEYIQRLKPYAKVGLLEIPEEPFREHDDREAIQAKEAKKVLNALSDDSFVIALHERGKEFTSETFAQFLKEKSTHGEKLTFIIGGPLGWHESVLKRANLQLSLSQLTFPHQLVRVILFEQLYRAATIIQGKQYHY